MFGISVHIRLVCSKVSLIVITTAAADVILWRRRRVSCGLMMVATVAWFLFERSGLSFLSVCCDILLILIVLRFLRANYAVLRERCYNLHQYQFHIF